MAIVFSGTFATPFFVTAETKKILKTEDRYYLTVGLQPVEYDPGPKKWENGQWGGIKKFSSSFNLPKKENDKKFELIEVAPYNFAVPNYAFDEKCSGHTYLASDSNKFESVYSGQTSINISVTASILGNRISYNCNTLLSTHIPFEIYNETRIKGEAETRSKLSSQLGSWSEFTSQDPVTANAIDQAISRCNDPKFIEAKLYLVYTPIVFHYKVTYEEEVEEGFLEAGLDLPVKAKQGETFQVKDATLLADNLIYKEGILSRKVLGKDEDFVTIATWKGLGNKAFGKNSGQSINQSFDEICMVDYRLEVETENGQRDEVTKRINIIDKTEVKGKAILELPNSVYEGHTVGARDDSEFTVDGKKYYANRAYEEDLATNDVDIDSGNGYVRRSKSSKVLFDTTFTKVGRETATLYVYLNSGEELKDTKPIKVLRTPAITSSLTGFQKQNRRQTIKADIAVNPSYPVTDWFVEITDCGTGETLIVNKDFTGSATANEPNFEAGNIKARKAEFATDQNGCYSHITVDFLTKNPSVQGIEGVTSGNRKDGGEDYCYRVWVKDTRGHEDEYKYNFYVRPDFPPKAEVKMEPNFLRNEGSDVAKVVAEDLTTTDGDSVQREWVTYNYPNGSSVAAIHEIGSLHGATAEHYNKSRPILPDTFGYEDLSFGSGQKIAFNKVGVGSFEVGIRATDLWREDTLSEFIQAKDYLSSYGFSGAKVVDVAPIVSIEPVEYVSTSLYMLTRSNQDYLDLLKMKTDLKTQLLEKGIIAEIAVEQMSVQPVEEWTQEDKGKSEHYVWSAEGQMAFLSDWTNRGGMGVYNTDNAMQEKFFHYVDEDTVYRVEGTWECTWARQGASAPDAWNYRVVLPYTFTATDIITGQQKWEVVIGKGEFTSSGSSQNHFVVDKTGKFLFFTGDSQTLIMNRDTGAILGKIPAVIGDDVFCSDDSIYYLKDDGIYGVDKNLGVSKIYAGAMALHDSLGDIGGAAVLINREIHAVTLNQGKAVRVVFNIDNQELKFQDFSGIKDSLGLNIIGWSSRGEVVIGQRVGGATNFNYRSKKSSIWDESTLITENRVFIYDDSGQLIRRIDGIPTDRATQIAWKSDGSFEYLVTVYNGSSGSYYYSYSDCYNARSGEKISSFEKSRKSKDTYGYNAEASRTLFARDEKEKVTVATGTFYGTSENSRSLSFCGVYVGFLYITHDTKTGEASAFRGNTIGGAGKNNNQLSDGRMLSSAYRTPYYLGASFGCNWSDDPIEKQGNLRWGYINQKALSLDDLYASFLNRGLQQARNQKRAVVLYDSKPAIVKEKETMDKTVEAITSSESDLLTGIAEGESSTANVSESTEPTYLDKIREGVAEAGYKVTDFLNGMELVNKLVEIFTDKDKSFNVLEASVESENYGIGENTSSDNGVSSGNGEDLGNAYIERSYDLSPFTKYYYEIELEGKETLPAKAVSVTTKLQSTVQPELLTGRQYKVVEEHYEDFSDETKADSFFKLGGFSNGHYPLFFYCTWKYDSGGTYADRTIEIPIPHGKVGTFEVTTERVYNSAGSRIFIYDEKGNMLDLSDTFRQGGPWKYAGKVLLPEGNNKVVFRHPYVKYGWDDIIWFLDDIKVQILEPTEDFDSNQTGVWNENLISNQYREEKGGSQILRGDFQTIGLGYNLFREQKSKSFHVETPMEYTPLGEEDVATTVPVPLITKSGNNYAFNILKGEFSAFLIAEAVYKGSRTARVNMDRVFALNNNYTYPDISIYNNFAATSWKLAGRRSFNVSATFDSLGQEDKIKAIDEEIYLKNFRGLLVNEIPEPLSAGAFYYGDGNGDGTAELLLQDVKSVQEEESPKGTQRVNFRLELPTGDSRIKDFKIYTYFKGKKVYVDEGLATNKWVEKWNRAKNTKLKLLRITEEHFEKPKDALIYKKGENVGYNLFYSDFEKDPKKSDYWIYTHTPYNDGLNLQAGVILNEKEEVIKIAGNPVPIGSYSPEEAAMLIKQVFEKGVAAVKDGKNNSITSDENDDCQVALEGGNTLTYEEAKRYVLSACIEKFYIDGKYQVSYFAYDDTSRGKTKGGYPEFDKASDFANITFYVLGETLTAPYITFIETEPQTPEADFPLRVKVGIDDEEKDLLNLTVEIYRGKKRIIKQYWENLEADSSGNYPVSLTETFKGEAEKYTVIATVRDNTGVGAGTYSFFIEQLAGIEGRAFHTEKWEDKRLLFNKKYKFSETGIVEKPLEISYKDYMERNTPRPRYSNVFWTGEKFMLEAEVLGKPKKVIAKLYENNDGKWKYAGIETGLENGIKSGKGDKGGTATRGSETDFATTVYKGQMWQRDFVHRWGLTKPEHLKVVFIADYGNNKLITDEVFIIVDGTLSSELLHRVK